jgi:transposase InsO family protein
MIQDTKSLTVIKCFLQNFARYGIPEKLVSDNGPEYSSYKFQTFTRDFGFKHITSSPRYTQSNGLVERTVQAAKKKS